MAKTLAQVQKQIEQLQKQAEQLRKKEADGVRTRIQEAITVYGFTAEDFDFAGGAGPRRAVRGSKAAASRPVGAGARSRVKARPASAAKYQDGQGHSWGGRGPRPAWFKAALEAGRTLEELRA